MLVLTRAEAEELVIDLRDVNLNDIPVEDRIIHVGLVSVRGNRCRHSIEAPRVIPVHRGEVFARIKTEETVG